jgi:hypothetical protein
MTKKEIENEAEHFFEWPDDSNKYTVTLTSCILFAEYILKLSRKQENKLDSQD